MKQKLLTSIIILLVFIGCVEPQVEPKIKIEPKLKVQKIKKVPIQIVKLKPKETFTWDKTSIAYISQKEYDKVMEEYIKKKYPKKVKTYKWKKKQEQIKKAKKQKELQRQKELEKKYQKELKIQRKIKNHAIIIGRLMWQDNKDVKIVQRDWQGAKKYCNNLSLADFYDWRLAKKRELIKLYDNKIQLNYPSSYNYWSSTITGEKIARYVNFYGGDVYNGYKNDKFYVRCVRDR